MTSSESQPRTRAGRDLVAAFEKGLPIDTEASRDFLRRLPLHVQDIEAEAAQDSRPLDVERLARWLYKQNAEASRRHSPHSRFPDRWEDNLWWKVNPDRRHLLVEDWMSKARDAIEYARLAEKPHD